jgi:hypothetical protein
MNAPTGWRPKRGRSLSRGRPCLNDQEAERDRRLALCFLLLLLTAAPGLTCHAWAGPSDFAPVTLSVACGESRDTRCAKVLPTIAVQTARSGLDLKPAPGAGAVAVCQGQAGAAIVQRDAIARPSCLGRYDLAGRALFPYYVLLVVRADASFRSLDDLGRDARRLAAGEGGRITLDGLLQSNPLWRQNIAVTDDDATTALERIASGSIDGLFATETLDNAMVDRVRLAVDPLGKPLYRFIDVRPGTDFLKTGDGSGHCLYRLTALDFGGPSPVTTISVDAVMMLGRGFRDAHARGGPRAADALASAIDAAQTAILAETKSPAGWRPGGNSCQ